MARQDSSVRRPAAPSTYRVSDGRIDRVWAVRNPEKLSRWTAG
ncbi:hypothetical protein OG474_29160 [Kribbella sp. NBC_01505]